MLMYLSNKPYPAYKDSGVEWLGKVPEHWKVRRLKNWLGINRRVLPEDTDPEYTFQYVDIGSVSTGRLTETPKRLRFGNTPSRARRIVAHGDTIVSTVRTYLKAVWYADNLQEPLIASTGFAVLTPDKNTLPKFVSYICESNPFTDLVTSESVGIAYPAIAETRLGTFSVCIPPLPEQAAIARFLDHTTQRVQHHIHAKQKLIKLLEEQKQVITHQAVTGQINVQTGQPYPAYKNSGVEWLGDVPEHWEMRRNGWLFSERSETGYGSLPILEVSLHKGVGIRDMEAGERKQQMSERDRYKRAKKRDIAYNTMRMWQGAVGVVPADGLVSPAYVVLKPIDRIESDYYGHLFRTDAYKRVVKNYSRGIVSDRDRLYWDEFKRIMSVVPPTGEQTAITRFLGHTNHRISKHHTAVKREIDLLHEYRTRLIADVVTGKLDVREAAAHLPESAPPALAATCQDGTELADPGQNPYP
ncbi:MAG: restriction endonuclease subunit S [Synechococcus sp. SB0662_bin_14]|nr:restriction endonuclease subunit S [Synechococcus sp. SB0662_bin_14]